jgi:hypothetical protein
MSKKLDSKTTTVTTNTAGDIIFDADAGDILVGNGTTFTAPMNGTYNVNSGIVWIESPIEKMEKIIEKNLECGLLLDWDVKVKDTELARKMYPDHCTRNGWLYGKKV